jgi:hypothetical protein
VAAISIGWLLYMILEVVTAVFTLTYTEATLEMSPPPIILEGNVNGTCAKYCPPRETRFV